MVHMNLTVLCSYWAYVVKQDSPYWEPCLREEELLVLLVHRELTTLGRTIFPFVILSEYQGVHALERFAIIYILLGESVS